MKDERELIKAVIYSEYANYQTDSREINRKVDLFLASPEYAAVPEIKQPEPVIPAGCPEWLTPFRRALVLQTWNSHELGNMEDHKRVDAIKMIQTFADDAGYQIGIDKAINLFKDFIQPKD